MRVSERCGWHVLGAGEEGGFNLGPHALGAERVAAAGRHPRMGSRLAPLTRHSVEVSQLKLNGGSAVAKQTSNRCLILRLAHCEGPCSIRVERGGRAASHLGPRLRARWAAMPPIYPAYQDSWPRGREGRVPRSSQLAGAEML